MSNNPPMRIVMMGTGVFAEPTFRKLLDGPDEVIGLFTQPDRGTGSKSGSTRQTGEGMKPIAEAAGVPVFQPHDVNTPEGVASLKSLNADLLVVAAYGQILADEVMDAARLGGVNVHASLLPKYRGAAPINWAIYRGEAETGVTIIRMTSRLDGGDMLAKQSTPIGDDVTAGELEAKLAPMGAALAAGVIDRLRAGGHVTGEKQDPDTVTKAPKLKKTHGLIKWHRTAAEVERQIRAMQPWPSPHAFWHRQGSTKPPIRLQILKAKPTGGATAATPGEVVGDPAGDKRLTIAAGGDVLEVLELQPAGKRRMAAAEYLRGQPITAGDRFGPEALS